MEATAHSTPPPNRFDPGHSRFRHDCRGVDDDPTFRCGELHDCRGHARDRAPDPPYEPVGPLRPCRREVSESLTVCATHGGSAPQVVAAARERAARFADEAVDRLIGVARGPAVRDGDRIRALQDLLDRAGVPKVERTPADVETMVREDPTLIHRILELVESDPTILGEAPA